MILASETADMSVISSAFHVVTLNLLCYRDAELVHLLRIGVPHNSRIIGTCWGIWRPEAPDQCRACYGRHVLTGRSDNEHCLEYSYIKLSEKLNK
jgi:hypothetical protein